MKRKRAKLGVRVDEEGREGGVLFDFGGKERGGVE